jgi:threonine 3-dehydrogenase
MDALVKETAAPGLVLTTVPEPTIGINDVLIRVDRTGICGPDIHIADWNEWAQTAVRPPLIVGHEFVGEIVDVGSNVSDFRAGDLVSGEGHVVCGRCRNCMAGRRHLCAQTSSVGVDRPGAFAEYIALPMTNVWLHDPAIDRDVAAIFDPFGNAVHSALQFPVLGEDVLITGAGPIGLMACAVAQHAGARYVVVTDVNPYRLELAKTLGATVALDIRERAIDDVQHELGMREGFDVGLEMSGNPDAFHAMLGLPDRPFAIDWNLVIHDMMTIKGVFGREMYETWSMMTVMLQGGLDVGPVITHRFHYTQHEEAFAAVRSGHAGKVLLTWREEP